MFLMNCLELCIVFMADLLGTVSYLIWKYELLNNLSGEWRVVEMGGVSGKRAESVS